MKTAKATFKEISRETLMHGGSVLLLEDGNKNLPLALIQGQKRSGPMWRMFEVTGKGVHGVLYVASDRHPDHIDIAESGIITISEG